MAMEINADELPEGWNVQPLEELCKTKPQSGGTPLTSVPEYYKDGTILWAMTEDLTEAGMHIHSTRKKITKLALENSTARLFPKGTILFAMYGSIGRMSITEVEMTTNQAILGIQPDEKKILPKYMYYYLEYAKKHLVYAGRGGSQANVNAKMVKEFPVAYPPLPTQQKIVTKLNAFFEHYDEVKKQHELEKARAKKIILATISKLIPNPDEELPEGWDVKKIGEICDIWSGFGFPNSFQGKTYGAYPFIKVGDMDKNSDIISEAKNYVDETDVPKLKAKIFPPKTIIFPKIGMAIRLNKRNILKIPAIIDNNVMGILPSSKIEHKYLFYYLKTIDMFELANTTTVPALRKTDIYDIVIPLPPRSIQQKTIARLDTINDAASTIRQEQIREQRLIDILPNAILRKAFSGELVS